MGTVMERCWPVGVRRGGLSKPGHAICLVLECCGDPTRGPSRTQSWLQPPVAPWKSRRAFQVGHHVPLSIMWEKCQCGPKLPKNKSSKVPSPSDGSYMTVL